MDNELDELLDSALDDFDKNKEELKKNESIEVAGLPADSEPQASGITIEKTNLNVEVDTGLKSSIEDDMKLFEEIFSGEQNKDTLKQFSEAMKMFKNEDAGMFKEFEKMMETMSTTSDIKGDLNLYEDDIDEDDDRDQAKAKINNKSSKTSNSEQKPLDKVLEDIAKQSEKVLKNTGGSDSGMFNEEFLLSQLNLDDNSVDDSDPTSSLLMQPLITMLFSKEILYPSLKMMLENYEKYLETNKDKLNASEFSKYSDQKDCIIQMCHIYEVAKETDSQEVKSSQQSKILDLLEKCGNPPAELVPEMSPFAGMGSNFMKDSCPIS